ncbi:WcaI family glycosyltransferase [Rubrivivax rivuli]|uniref:Colanic acid biosynthesis glycosyltransferase WcaI n=1 Tax=Rubrivivax rivuli TaxID=1862385 RepID=A0A437RED2_9BURK|nr:WcaI family glycosyltransferase [Rubrivivax rivuli]RVU45111.1 colanic acid biosynthesis glycosyltransferase WcaI [Rubrivivax rivuli]
MESTARTEPPRHAHASGTAPQGQRLLLLSLNYSPELTGIGKYSGEMAESLAARGHELTVVCAPPHYPAWSVHAGHSAWRYSVDRSQPGLTVVRCPTWVPRRPGGAQRLLYQASFALSSLPVMLWTGWRWRPDVVWTVAPATLSAPVAWLTARLCGSKAWLHVQDLEFDAAFRLGLLRGQLLRQLCGLGERALLGSFDRVSTISRRMLRHLACKGVGLARSSLLPNWVDLEALDSARQTAAAAALRRQLGIAPGQKVALFSGTMNRKQGLHTLVQAAELLRHRDDIVFLLCGQGEMRPALEEAGRGLPQLRFIDLRPAHELGALLALADVHLLPQLREAADLVLPSKLGGMLASGRAIVAGVDADSEIATLVQHAGQCVQPESAQAFAMAIQSLCDDDAERLRLGEVARRLALTRLGRVAVMDALEAELFDLAGRGLREPAPGTVQAAEQVP